MTNKINSGNLESPNKTMLPFNEKVEQNIINQQNKVNNEKKMLTDKKGTKKMEKEETKNGTNMNKYLELSFQNAGFIMIDNNSDKQTKDKLSYSFNYHNIEPITKFDVSNVIHKLFGQMPVPTFRQSNIPIIAYLYNKASESYLKIDNNIFNQEAVMNNKGGVDYILKFEGKIYVPITEYDIEKIKKGPGTATILDGGLVRIEGILNEEDLPDDMGRKVSELSTKHFKNIQIAANYSTIDYVCDDYYLNYYCKYINI